MELRSFRWSDVEAISKIWKDHHANLYGLPNRRTAIVDAVVEDQGEIIGYGQVKLFAEGMLFLDKSKSVKTRIQALKLFMLEAFRGTERAGLQEMYAFIEDPAFALLLEKHYHFFTADKPGRLLVKEIK